MKTADYRKAVEWIACYDECEDASDFDIEYVRNTLTVCLIANIFGLTNYQVAAAVLKARKKAREGLFTE